MVRWLVEQGHSVFMIKWRNPGAAQAQLNFEDYVLEGVVKAVNAIETITGQEQINAAGYCIGGTVLATTIAYYAAKRMKNASNPRAFHHLAGFLSTGRNGSLHQRHHYSSH